MSAAGGPPGPVFVVEGVTYAYPGYPECVSEVSFEVRRGERVVLLGPNGSGKSTLLNLLDGLCFPTSGRIAAFGEALGEEALERTAFGARFRREVGFLFQDSEAQLFCPTVEEELAFGPLQLDWGAQEIRRRISDTLELLEISHLRKRTVVALSVGEKKKVALASLLVMGPSVLLLDEPTSGLDLRSQAVLLEILDSLRLAGLTFITATHDLTVVPHLADRALVLGEDHRLKADRPAEAVLTDTALLLDVNLIHAHAHRHGALVHTHPHEHVIGHEHGHLGTVRSEE